MILVFTKSPSHIIRYDALSSRSLLTENGSSRNQSSCSESSNGYPWFFSSCRPFRAQKLSVGPRRSVIVGVKKKNNKERKKEDKHSFVSKPDEATGLFPEAVLLRQKQVQEDGADLPEFADEDEEKVYEFLKLQLQDDLDEERLRHYEVIYLIHEKHEEKVGSVKEKIEVMDFLSKEAMHDAWSVASYISDADLLHICFSCFPGYKEREWCKLCCTLLS